MDFFTGQKGKAPPKLPSKPQKKAATDLKMTPTPTTLVAARSIGTHKTATPTSLQQPDVSPSKPTPTFLPSGLVATRDPSISQPLTTSSGVPLNPPKPALQPSDAKSNQTPSPPSERPAESLPKAGQIRRPAQPVKRPKQPPSLFIPKKVRFNRALLTALNPISHSQRPPPGSGGGEPPNKKRA